MTVYLVNIIFILIWGLLLTHVNPTQRKKAIFCGIASFQWILISGLRHVSIGADTRGYVRSFIRVGQYSWKEIFDAFAKFYFSDIDKVVLSDGGSLSKDAGYLIFQKFVHIFTDDPQVYLIIVAVIIFVSLGYFIYKNSEDPCFSYILFSTLFYSFYAITGIRQALATALAVFIGYEFIKQQKFWKFLVVIVIAFTIHKSVLVFFPFYFLARKKITWRYMAVVAGASVAAISIGAPLILKLGKVFGYDRENVYMADTSTYTFLMALLGIGTILLYKHIQRQNSSKDMEINAVLLATGLTLLTTVDQATMRVQQYYALFLMFGIPNIYSCFSKKDRIMIQTICVAALSVLFIRNNPHYMFFWQ